MVTGSAEKVFSSSKNKLNPCKIKGFRTKYGGDKGVRTPDLLNAIQARSQLRHTPTYLF